MRKTILIASIFLFRGCLPAFSQGVYLGIGLGENTKSTTFANLSLGIQNNFIGIEGRMLVPFIPVTNNEVTFFGGDVFGNVRLSPKTILSPLAGIYRGIISNDKTSLNSTTYGYGLRLWVYPLEKRFFWIEGEYIQRQIIWSVNIGGIF